MRTNFNKPIVIFLLFSIFSCAEKEVTLQGIVRNYISHEAMANVTVNADSQSSPFFFETGCKSFSEQTITNSNGKFLMNFSHNCGFQFYLDLSDQKYFNKLTHYQLVINDVPNNTDRVFSDMTGPEMIVEVQPYINLILTAKEIDSLILDYIYIPEFDIRIDSLKKSDIKNLYLRQFTGKLNVFIIYQNKQVKKTIDYDYFAEKYLKLEIEI